MRTIIASLIVLLGTSAHALANRCYWVNGHAYCDSGCWITDRWWDGYREWMRYSCGPPPELLAIAAAAVLTIIVIAIGKAIAHAVATSSSTDTAALAQATDEADAKAAEAQRITDNLRVARAEADHFLKTYRRR